LKTLVSLYAVHNLLSFADLRCRSEITATGCIIGAQNPDYVYPGKTGTIGVLLGQMTWLGDA